MKRVPILNVTDTGNGPVVVLLHGYMASSLYWRVFASHLSRNHRVIALDLLGFGKSPKPLRSRYDYTAQIQSIEATLDRIGLDEPFVLIGHSMGALISLRFARQNQSRIKKLVLTNMPVLMDTIDARSEIMGTNFFYSLGLRRGLHSIIWPVFKAITYLRLLPAQVAEGAVDRRRYIFQSHGISRLRSMRNLIFAVKIQADLEATHVSTVLISGLNDRKRYLQNVARLKIQENVKILTVAGGHHLPLTNPVLLAQQI